MSYYTGIDIGSRFVKIAVYKKECIVDKLKFDTANFYKNFCKIQNNKLIVDFKKIKIPFDNLCSTGYGRNNVNIANSLAINEIKAHTWGIFSQLKLENFTLIDIGGQDVKIVKVIDSYIDDFIMNDKCAASTGRFIENIAQTLDISLEYLSCQVENPIPINSTCAIFSETEVIGKLAEGVDVKRICAGINYTIAKRIGSMANNIFTPPLVLSGGVSLNKSIIFFLKQLLKVSETIMPEEPQFNGAIGCVNYIQTLQKS